MSVVGILVCNPTLLAKIYKEVMIVNVTVALNLKSLQMAVTSVLVCIVMLPSVL